MDPYVVDLKRETKKNEFFRRVLFTSSHSQLVIMALRQGEDIGLETHPFVDQILYAVEGDGVAVLAGQEYEFGEGSVVCVPAGTEHNIVNSGDEGLQLFTVYAPPQHPAGTVQQSKPVAQPATV